MAALSTLYQDILPYVPGCPDPMLDQEIRQAARMFFARTKAWVQWLEEVFVSGALREYDLDLPTQTEIVRVQRATVDGRPVEVVGWNSLPSDLALHATGGSPQLVSSADRMTVTIGSPGAAGSKLQVQVALMPSQSAASIPDTVLLLHRDAIAEGAKYRLMRVPGPLSKPQEAEQARVLFERAIAASSVDAWRGHTNATPRSSVKWC